jgi:hypothetical protein
MRDSASSFISPRSAALWAFCRTSRNVQFHKRSQLFHPLAQRNAFHRRDVRQQSRLSALYNPTLKRNPSKTSR